jgi:hypothetical protein
MTSDDAKVLKVLKQMEKEEQTSLLVETLRNPKRVIKAVLVAFLVEPLERLAEKSNGK